MVSHNIPTLPFLRFTCLQKGQLVHLIEWQQIFSVSGPGRAFILTGNNFTILSLYIISAIPLVTICNKTPFQKSPQENHKIPFLQQFFPYMVSERIQGDLGLLIENFRLILDATTDICWLFTGTWHFTLPELSIGWSDLHEIKSDKYRLFKIAWEPFLLFSEMFFFFFLQPATNIPGHIWPD